MGSSGSAAPSGGQEKVLAIDYARAFVIVLVVLHHDA